MHSHSLSESISETGVQAGTALNPARPAAETPAAAPKPRRTLMVVDDEEGPRQSLRIVFKEDYNILMANDGLQAIELAKLHHVDAAILDIRMFGMTGVDLLERLKAADPAVEVIMLTAYETLETARQALRCGACDYLNKPFDISTMRAAVSKAMERRALSDEVRANQQILQDLKTEIYKQRETQEMIRTRGEIYASIIHDINGPLTIISGFIETINERLTDSPRLEGEDLSSIKERLERITRQVNNCIEISRRYLRFLREERNETSLVAVNQILQDAVQLLQHHRSATGHQINLESIATEAFVRINGTELIQILLNLGTNALQSTSKPHQVDILCQRLDQPLNLDAFQDSPESRFVNRESFKNTGHLLAFTVADNGPGIPADVVPRIFESYFTTKAVGQGNGLGLSIVARLVKEAHGAVHLKTKVGHGTSFTVYLPGMDANALETQQKP
jgi:signal transduction histidine kinase